MSLMEQLQEQVNKYFKGNVVISLEDLPTACPCISTGIWVLDKAIGPGGIPLGKISELFGPEASGKTTVLLHTAASCQKVLKRAVLYLDYENCFDPAYAETLGMDLSRDMFALSQPDDFEQGMAVAEVYIQHRAVGLIIVDSLAAMMPRAEKEDKDHKPREFGDKVPMGAGGKAMADALKRLTGQLAKANCCMCFINQIRIDLAAAQRGITKWTTPYSRTLRFYASVRIQFTKIGGVQGEIEDYTAGGMEKGVIATVVEANVVKNKIAPPFRRAEFIIGQGTGYDDVTTIVRMGIARGWITKTGAWYTFPIFNELQKVQGERGVVDVYTNNPDAFKAFKDAVIEEAEGKQSGELSVPIEVPIGEQVDSREIDKILEGAPTVETSPIGGDVVGGENVSSNVGLNGEGSTS